MTDTETQTIDPADLPDSFSGHPAVGVDAFLESPGFVASPGKRKPPAVRPDLAGLPPEVLTALIDAQVARSEKLRENGDAAWADQMLEFVMVETGALGALEDDKAEPQPEPAPGPAPWPAN